MHTGSGWLGPPAPPHQLLEPRLIASMQFELISCFRWSSANQGRQEAEVGAIKLTALGPGSLRRKKQSRHQKAPPPTPTSPSLGKPGTAARAERRASPALPHPGPTTPRANNAPLWQLISHRQTACGSCRDLVNKEQRHKLSRGGGGCGLSWGEGGAHSPQMGEWVPVILSETKGDASLPAGQLPSPLGRRACRTLLSLQGMCCPLEKKESIQKSISTCQSVHPC